MTRRIETTHQVKDKTAATEAVLLALAQDSFNCVTVQYLPGLNPELPYEVRVTTTEEK